MCRPRYMLRDEIDGLKGRRGNKIAVAQVSKHWMARSDYVGAVCERMWSVVISAVREISTSSSAWFRAMCIPD